MNNPFTLYYENYEEYENNDYTYDGGISCETKNAIAAQAFKQTLLQMFDVIGLENFTQCNSSTVSH